MDEYVAVPGIWAEVSSGGRAHSFDGRLSVCSSTKNHNIFHTSSLELRGKRSATEQLSSASATATKPTDLLEARKTPLMAVIVYSLPSLDRFVLKFY